MRQILDTYFGKIKSMLRKTKVPINKRFDSKRTIGCRANKFSGDYFCFFVSTIGNKNNHH